MANVTYQALLAAVDDLVSFVADIGKELSEAQEAAVLAREHVVVTIAGRLGLAREILVPSGDWPAWERTRTGLFIGPLWKFGLAAEWREDIQRFRAMVAELATLGETEPTAGKSNDTLSGTVPQSMLPWPANIPEKDRLKFLDEHKADIPNRSEGRRRMVDAAAFLAYLAKRNKAGFSLLDDVEAGDRPGIMPEKLSDAEYLEIVVPLLQQVAGTKQKRRRKP